MELVFLSWHGNRTGHLTLFQRLSQRGGGLFLYLGKVRVTQSLAAMGYRQAFIHKDTILGSAGTELRGHEFHYTSLSEDTWKGVFGNLLAKGEALSLTGFMTKNLVASHLHWHFFSNPQALASFLQIAQYLQ